MKGIPLWVRVSVLSAVVAAATVLALHLYEKHKVDAATRKALSGHWQAPGSGKSY